MANITCKFCGSIIDEHDESCPICSAPNPQNTSTNTNTNTNENQTTLPNYVPKTIEEFKYWYHGHQLKATQISTVDIGFEQYATSKYVILKQDDGNCFVYKNENNGNKVMIYQGPDELVAIHKMLLEIDSVLRNKTNINHTSTIDDFKQTIKPLLPEQQKIIKNVKKTIKTIIIIFLAIQFIPIVITLLIILFASFLETKEKTVPEFKDELVTDVYYVEGNNLYFLKDFDGEKYNYLTYDLESEEWFSLTADANANTLPFNQYSELYYIAESVADDYPQFEEDKIVVD